jgi:hypothetical protein
VSTTGYDNRVGGNGKVQFVTAARLFTATGPDNVPFFAGATFDFSNVPEPGTGLMVGAGIAGLAVAGRRRMRK